MKSNRRSMMFGAAFLAMNNACSSDNATRLDAGGGLQSAGGNASNTSVVAALTGGASAALSSTNGGVSRAESQAYGGWVTSNLGGGSASAGAVGAGGSSHTTGASNAGGASDGTKGEGGRSAQGGATTSSVSSSFGGASTSSSAPGVGSSAAGGFTSSAGANTSGGATHAGGTTSAGGTSADGPCDIFRAAGTPCVAAHSTVRALLHAYSGRLYQVRRADNTTRDISTLSTGGFADGPAQATFCSGSTCVVTAVYDQTGNGNDLWYQGSTVVPGSPQSSPAKADTESLTVSGHKVYSLYIKPGNSYWRDGSKSGVPTGKSPEGLYMVTSGKHVNGGCCFDYGNSETTRKVDAAGAMDAINFGTQCWFGGCSGTGPWVQADLEWGLFPGGSQAWNANQKAFSSAYVTAMLKNNGATEFALKGGNAQSGSLTSLYKGALPNGYNPMKKQGAIVLGSGGDCCKPDGGANLSEGTFYEGAIVAGYPTDATEDSVQSNVVAAGYGAAAAGT